MSTGTWVASLVPGLLMIGSWLLGKVKMTVLKS
jgi:hypothetical protein